MAVKVTIVDWRAAGALAFALPYLAYRTVVTEQVQPALTMLRAGGDWSAEVPLLFVTLGLLLAGAALALEPAIGSKRYPVLNLLVAGGLLVGFVYLGFLTGQDQLGCSVLSLTWCG
ncbi:hypothetical protein [Antribacter gilvus]|uniref:hypothetical protein n=1 Tax=Antribacter gilvus TaxID=2304675 RepID=UPI000F7971D9|nr:hypothetical protein [Antribacter gilvus]